MRELFRWIVVVSTGLFVLVWLLPFFDYRWLNQDELDVLSCAGQGSVLPSNVFIYWGLFVLWLIVSIGLWFFVAAARTAFLSLLIITSIASFFWGPSIRTPLETGIGNIVMMSDGAILVMAYFTSISSEFKKPYNKRMRSDRQTATRFVDR